MKLKNTVRLSHLYPSVKLLDVYDELFAYDAKTNLLTWINDKKENNIEKINYQDVIIYNYLTNNINTLDDLPVVLQFLLITFLYSMTLQNKF